MTTSLDRSTQTATIFQRADASWQDYLDARDSHNLEWHKISFNNGWSSLDLDLDEQKQIYASLGIAEHWVVDVKGMRLFA